MNGPPSAPFTMVYMNITSLSAHLSTWQQLVHDQRDRLSLPSTPLLYAFVESGHAEPRLGAPGWLCSHHPGPATGGGGISLLYHSSCAVTALPLHTVAFGPNPSPTPSASTAMVWHAVRPAGRAPFLLATVYLPPAHVPKLAYVEQILASLDSVPPQFGLPVLVVGDFNLRHTVWHQPPHNPGAPGRAASTLAAWISHLNNRYTVANKPGSSPTSRATRPGPCCPRPSSTSSSPPTRTWSRTRTRGPRTRQCSPPATSPSPSPCASGRRCRRRPLRPLACAGHGVITAIQRSGRPCCRSP